MNEACGAMIHIGASETGAGLPTCLTHMNEPKKNRPRLKIVVTFINFLKAEMTTSFRMDSDGLLKLEDWQRQNINTAEAQLLAASDNRL